MSLPTTSSPHEFATPDLGEATFVALQLPLLALRRDGQKILFVFPAAAAPLARKFWFPGENNVNARRYHAQLKDLRALVRREMGR